MALLTAQAVKQMREELTEFFDKVCRIYCTDSLVYELMYHRKYNSIEMFNTLKEIGVFKVDYLSELLIAIPDVTNQQLRDWGLVNERNEFILGGRYVVAIRDIAGKVIALVGWHPKGGSRKYVTTPTLGFSRDASFFNYDSYKLAWERWNGVVYLVEGIFDAIALRSLGLAAIAVQGLEMSPIKMMMLTRFSKVIAIPDNDRSGRAVNPLTNAVSGKKKSFVWTIENEHVFVQLPEGVKDVDQFINEFDALEDLISCQNSQYLKKLKIVA